MKTTLLARALLATGLLASGLVSAQSYSRTETITYADNTTKWVLGQTASVTCTAAIPASTSCDGNDVMSQTGYDATYALPLTFTAFGKLQQTATYDTTSSVAAGLRGTLKTVKDGNNKTTTFSNWKRGIPQSIGYADSTAQSAVVDDNGWLSSVTDENGYQNCYGYDAMGRLTRIEYPQDATGGCDTGEVNWNKLNRSFVPVASTEYGIPAGHWRETTTTGNATKITYYDGMWRPLLVREYDASNISGTERFTKAAYDAEGRTTFASYPSTTSTPTTGVWTDYDALGRVTSVSQDSELGLLTSLTTYNTGFTTTVTNPRGQSATTSYMTFDQPSTDWPVSILAPESATTTIGRDPYGKPTSLVRSGGGASATRSYTYNGYQELCRSVEPETGATLFGYDAAGNLSWSAAGLASTTACSATGTGTTITNRKVSRTYDARNRLTDLTFPTSNSNGNQHWTYTPDGLPSLVTTLNKEGATSNTVTNAYTYNKRRLLTGESMVPDTVQTGWGVGYGYNSLGQVTSETTPASVSVNYTVNALGQVSQVTTSSDGGAASTIVSGASYYPNGAVKQFSYGNGIVHTMTQNARQLPSKSTDCTLAGTCAVANRRLDLGYSFDANGNVASITDGTTAGRQTRTMGYDNLDRLTSTTSPMFGTASYAYDALDNLKQVNVSGGTQARNHYYCYNTTNQLSFVRTGSNCSSSPAVTTLGYDVQGNLSNKNGTGYTFDFGNRLRTTASLTYRYDADGRRVRHNAAGDTQLKYSYYAKDGRVVWQRDEPGSKRISNIYFAGSLVAEYVRPIGSTAVTISYLHTDALGSPIAKTNASKTVIETSEYEPYGKLLNRANDDRAGYTGHVMDSASGLTYMQQRYYDPGIGRFLSVDPVTANSVNGSNFNRYWYANNNPYRFTDPDGRQSVGEMIDSGAQGCGAVSCAGWAALKAGWEVFGFEGVSQIADKGAAAGKGNGAIAILEVVTLGKGGPIVKGGEKLAEGGAKLALKMGEHAVEQATARGVKASQIIDAARNPLKITETKIDALGRPSQKLIGGKATIAVNPEIGKITTVHPTSSKLAEKLLRENQ